MECLVQIGADVNIGSGLDTPLCHACTYGDERIVGILLHKGVTDIQTALHLSLQLGHHQIVGLILKHFSCDLQGECTL